MSKKSKVLYIDFGPGFGGSVVNLSQLLTVSDELNVEPYLLIDHDDQKSKEILQPFTKDFYYVKRGFNFKFGDKFIFESKVPWLKKVLILFKLIIQIFLNIPFYVKSIRFGLKIKPDFIYCNNIVSIDEVIISWFLKSKVICHAQRDFYNSSITRLAFGFVDQFVAISQYVKRNLLQAGVKEEKIVVIYNGVSIKDADKMVFQDFDHVKEKFNFNGLKVGLFGCLLKWKGQDVLIDAVNIFMSRNRSSPVKFYIIGDSPGGDNSYENFLKNKVRENGLAESVEFSGYIKNVLSVMKLWDVVLHTSINPEPFGRVVIEAMSVGRPVIATNRGGPVEIIQNGKTGLLIEPGNPEALCEALESLLFNESYRLYLGRNAQDNVRLRFNFEMSILRFRKIFTLVEHDKI